MICKILKPALVLFALLSALPAFALETAWSGADHMRAKILSAVQTIGSFDSFDAALNIRMDEGWHSYWRTPGDSGLPPRFDWSGSENIESVNVLYPVPKRFDEYGLYTFGYAGDAVFPLQVNLKEPGKTAKLALALETMVCKDICIPQNLSVSLDIPAGAGEDSGAVAQIKYAARQIPVAGDTKDLAVSTVVASSDYLVISARGVDDVQGADVFVELQDGENIIGLTAKPEIEITDANQKTAIFKIAKPQDIENLSAFLQGKDLTITLVSDRDAVEKRLQF